MTEVDAAYAELRDCWKRDVDGVNAAELQRFFEFAEQHPHKPKPYSPTARISLAKKLAGMGDAEHQRQVIEQSISSDHVVLYALKDRPSKHALDSARVTQANQRKLVELKSRAARIGFRAYIDGEDVLGYATLVERAENQRPRAGAMQPVAKLLGTAQ